MINNDEKITNRRSIIVLSGFLFLLTFANLQAQQEREISAEQLEQILKHRDHLQSGVHQEFVRADLEEKARSGRIESVFGNPHFIRVINILQKNEEVFGQLEWTDDQKMSMKSVLSEIEKLEKEYASFEADDPNKPSEYEFVKKKKELLGKIRSEAMNFQVSEMSRLLVTSTNLLELLVEPTLISQHLEMTEQQKRRLSTRSNKLAKEVQEFIANKRLEASELFLQELTKEQSQKLVELYGGANLDSLFNSNSINNLLVNLMYGDAELEDHIRQPDVQEDRIKLDRINNKLWREIEK